MINPKRGEALWHFEGRDYRLCLTLGALAELEHHFETNGLAALGARLSQGSLASADILALLSAGLRGAGEDLPRETLLAIPVGDLFPHALDAIARMVEAAFGANDATEKSRGPFPGGR